jgi:uncharacterized protein YjbJ (UPF0337 family)
MEEIKHSTTWDKIAGQWKQFSGDIKKRWGNLTDDEVMEINGNREVLAGKIQEKYAIAREEANKQIDAWADEVKL